MKLSTQLHRSLFALPLLAVGLAAVAIEPPQIRVAVRDVLAAGLACGETARPVSRLALARMPADLGQLGWGRQCAAA